MERPNVKNFLDFVQNESREFKKDNNCVLTYNISDVDQSKDIFYSPELSLTYSVCPISFVPNIIYDLWDDYKFIEEFKPNITKSNTPAILWWFIKNYKFYDVMIKNYNIEQEQKKIKKGGIKNG